MMNTNSKDITELLAADDIKQMLSDFTEQDMAACRDLIILWRNRDGDVLIRTNLARITCLGLFAMATQAREKDYEGQ